MFSIVQIMYRIYKQITRLSVNKKHMIVRNVNEYHSYMRGKGANMYFMGFLDNNLNLREKGFVVSGYSGNDSHRYFKTKKEALNFIKTNQQNNEL